MNRNRTIDFFDSQFQRQARESEFALNPFERMALPFLRGRMLDLGCGMGNLSIEGARRGCSAQALDASACAIERVRAVAEAEALPIQAEVADIAAGARTTLTRLPLDVAPPSELPPIRDR